MEDGFCVGGGWLVGGFDQRWALVTRLRGRGFGRVGGVCFSFLIKGGPSGRHRDDPNSNSI